MSFGTIRILQASSFKPAQAHTLAKAIPYETDEDSYIKYNTCYPTDPIENLREVAAALGEPATADRRVLGVGPARPATGAQEVADPLIIRTCSPGFL